MKRDFNTTAGCSPGEEGVRESAHRIFLTGALYNICWISQICTCKLLGFTTHFRHIVSVTVLYNLISSMRFLIKIFFLLCHIHTKEKQTAEELRVCFWRVLYQLTPTADNYTKHLVRLAEWSILWTQQLRQQIGWVFFQPAISGKEMWYEHRINTRNFKHFKPAPILYISIHYTMLVCSTLFLTRASPSGVPWCKWWCPPNL